MKITNIKSTNRNNRFRHSADLVLNSGRKHEIYFEVNSSFSKFCAPDASPFFAAALPIAMKLGEGLEVEGSISKKLYNNASNIMKLWNDWKLGFKIISIKAKSISGVTKKTNLNACFFSGGADSFYTYLKNKKNINYLIFVHGFDINSENSVLFKSIEKNIIKIADQENKKIIQVKTNIRDTFEWYFDWDMSHTFALPSVALFLGNGFEKIYASCGQSSKNIPHHYMSPEIDRNWSTENMQMHHFGCKADKISKLLFLSRNKIAMENLRVCWVNKFNQYNCGECEKCYRNMLALFATNSLDKCKTFNKPLNSKRIENFRVPGYNIHYFSAVLEELKKRKNKSVIRYALDKCIKNTMHPSFIQRLKTKTRAMIRFVDKTYNRNRFYWFLVRKGLA